MSQTYTQTKIKYMHKAYTEEHMSKNTRTMKKKQPFSQSTQNYGTYLKNIKKFKW